MGEVASNEVVARCTRSRFVDPRMTALRKTKGVFTVSSPMCRFQAKIETRTGSRDVNKFVYTPTKWVTNSKVAEALDRRCSNISGPPFHRHIVIDGFCVRTVNTVLRALRQQMLDDGWISELELQFAGPSPSEPVFDLEENAATQWTDEFDDHTGWCTQERWKRFVG